MNTRSLRFRSNRVRDIVGLFHEELDAMYGRGEVSVFCEMLFEAFLGWDNVRLLTSGEQTIDQSDLLRFHWALEDLKQYRPIQHIVGIMEFCGCRIAVSPDVLIPRPETEEIVSWTISQLPIPDPQLTILDLCTGSGCIAIALKKAFPQAKVAAVDISDRALEVARQNARNNGVEVRFVEGDLLSADFNFQLPGVPSARPTTFNLIVSNPPYVRESERAAMQRNVLDYDPALALFVPDDDPLRFYAAIADIAKGHLSADGLLVVEINEALADESCALFRAQGFATTLHTDFRGRHRWIAAKRQDSALKPLTSNL